jgi:iron complex outermembrane receptor protein
VIGLSQLAGDSSACGSPAAGTKSRIKGILGGLVSQKFYLRAVAMAFALTICLVASVRAAENQATGESRVGSDATSENQINEIVVTAQKRSERLQDVPISVSAFSEAQLSSRGITTSSDLTQVTPGLFVGESNSLVTPFIRGVGASTNILGEVGSVPFYIDGVYMPMAQAGIYDLANIESVEVLKGPQGTLFGRNAAGGAISITTRAPQFTSSGSAEVSYGNFNAVTARGFVTGPLTDRIAGSFAVNYSRSDSYINDLFRGGKLDGSERVTVRGDLLIKPSDELSVLLKADYMRSSDPTPEALQPINGYLGLTRTAQYPIGPYDYIGELKPIQKAPQSGGSIRVSYSFPGADLISLTAYRKYDVFSQISADGTPIRYVDIDNNQSGNALSEELQLVSRGSGPLSWILGAYYSNEKDYYDPLVINDATQISANLTSHTYAAFVNGTYKLDDFELTAGLRYNEDKKSYDATLNGFTVVPDASHSWKSVTPRAVVAYHPNTDLLAYVSFTSGFKSGAYNYSAFATTPIDPETVDAYEVGLKYSPNRLVAIDTAVYYYKRNNIQVESQSPTTGLQLLENAASGTSKGADIDLTLRPIDALSLRVGLSYLDGTYSSFPAASVYVPYPPPPPPALPNSLGNNAVSANVTGAPFEHSPKWTGTVAASYKFSLPDDASIVPSINAFRVSSYVFTAGERLKQDPYTLLNAEITWHLPGDRVELSAWGKNLSNAVYLRSYFANSITDAGVYAEPRTYGILARVNF